MVKRIDDSNDSPQQIKPSSKSKNLTGLAYDYDILSAILNIAGALITVLSSEGKILAFNRACEQLTGYSAEEAIGRYLWDVANPVEEADGVRLFFLELFKREFPETHERVWTDKAGHRHLIKWRNTAIYKPNGELELVVGTGFDITESRKITDELREREVQLTERVKELRCLYNVSRLSERDDLNIDDFLQSVVELIPPAWQYPNICSARISIMGKEYNTYNINDAGISMCGKIIQSGQKTGEIHVFYSENPYKDGRDPFLSEEAHLMESICEATGRVVANYTAHQRIVEYQERLRSLASELALSGERERRRIAQELHNEIGHMLASMKYRLSELRKEKGDERISDILKLVEKTIETTRNITFKLSPPVLHELGLGAALEWLAHQLESNYGVPCYFYDDKMPKPLSEDVRVELFQAVREFLANVGKHSKASNASVCIGVENENLVIRVNDNGIGFDTALQNSIEGNMLGWGLFGARERLSHLGVDVNIDSALGKGTRITLVTPLWAGGNQVNTPAVKAVDSNTRLETVKQENIKILLVDDQQLTRAGLRLLLEKDPLMQVVAEASNGDGAVEMAKLHKPEVVVMDVAMPGMSGIEATRRILSTDPSIRVIGLSMHADGQYVVEMLRAGATGYLLKDCAQDDLSQAIRIVHANLTFLSPGLADKVAVKYIAGDRIQEENVETQSGEGKLQMLTPREIEVLKLLALGFNTKQSALKLNISVKTVETHRQHLMEKLDDRSIAGLTKLAISEGLINIKE